MIHFLIWLADVQQKFFMDKQNSLIINILIFILESAQIERKRTEINPDVCQFFERKNCKEISKKVSHEMSCVSLAESKDHLLSTLLMIQQVFHYIQTCT